MKKKSASQFAFFNLLVLIGLFVFLAGVFLALLGFGTFSNVCPAKRNSGASSRTQSATNGPNDRDPRVAQRPVAAAARAAIDLATHAART